MINVYFYIGKKRDFFLITSLAPFTFMIFFFALRKINRFFCTSFFFQHFNFRSYDEDKCLISSNITQILNYINYHSVFIIIFCLHRKPNEFIWIEKSYMIFFVVPTLLAPIFHNILIFVVMQSNVVTSVSKINPSSAISSFFLRIEKFFKPIQVFCWSKNWSEKNFE